MHTSTHAHTQTHTHRLFEPSLFSLTLPSSRCTTHIMKVNDEWWVLSADTHVFVDTHTRTKATNTQQTRYRGWTSISTAAGHICHKGTSGKQVDICPRITGTTQLGLAPVINLAHTPPPCHPCCQSAAETTNNQLKSSPEHRSAAK